MNFSSVKDGTQVLSECHTHRNVPRCNGSLCISHRSRSTSLGDPVHAWGHIHTIRPCQESRNLTLIFNFDAWLSLLAEGRCLWEWSSCKVLINDHRPCGQIYDHGSYKETWDNAASHLCSYKQGSRVSLGFVSGHGGADGGDDEEEKMERHAGARIRSAASKLLGKKLWFLMLLDR